MPTILRLEGFRFMIFQGDADHPPAHVHAFKAGSEIVLNLMPLAARSSKGMSGADARRARDIIEEHHELFLNAWSRLHA